MDYKDQRQAQRSRVGWQIQIIVGGETYVGTCKDISAIGVGVYGMPVLPIDAKVKVLVDTGAVVIEANAVIVRQGGDLSAPEVDGVRRITGLRFERLKPQTLGLLQKALGHS